MANNGTNPTDRALFDQRRVVAESLAIILVMTQPAYSSARAVTSRRGTDWVVEATWAAPGYSARRFSLQELSFVLSFTPQR